MLKRLFWIFAVVLAANGAALAVVARNARGAPDAILMLTEREMRLTNLGSDTTGMTLALEWDREGSLAWVVAADRPALPWFDRAKLATLGFDCSLDPGAPGALDYYSGPAVTPRTAYVVFEDDATRVAEGDRPRSSAATSPDGVAGRAGQVATRGEYAPRLRPVDAGNDACALRAKYASAHRYLVTAAVVRLRLVRASGSQPARLEGLILVVLPGEMYVPNEMQRTIADAVGKGANAQSLPGLLTRPPRYEVTVEYGSHLLPRLIAARALPR